MIFGLNHQQNIQKVLRIVQLSQPLYQPRRDVAFSVKRHHHRHDRQSRYKGRRRHLGVAQRTQKRGELEPRKGRPSQKRDKHKPQHRPCWPNRRRDQRNQAQTCHWQAHRFGPVASATVAVGHPGFGQPRKACAPRVQQRRLNHATRSEHHQNRSENLLKPRPVSMKILGVGGGHQSAVTNHPAGQQMQREALYCAKGINEPGVNRGAVGCEQRHAPDFRQDAKQLIFGQQSARQQDICQSPAPRLVLAQRLHQVMRTHQAVTQQRHDQSLGAARSGWSGCR